MSSRDVASWLNEQKLTVCEGFEFEALMCVRKKVEEVPPGLRRATVGRARVAAE